MKVQIVNEIQSHIETVNLVQQSNLEELVLLASKCINAIRNDGKIILFGNGGSAADAQHIAAELVGRYKTERKGIASIALTTDTSIITSISNDFGFEFLFSRQIEALANEKDVLIGISTGGTSINVVNALKTGRKMGCFIAGFSGKGGGNFNSLCDVNLIAPSDDTPRIQEMHILYGHIICELIDKVHI